MAKVNLISQAEYARRRGCVKSAVAKAVREGRITLIDGRIDPEVADIQWERNTRSYVTSATGQAAVDQVGAAVAPAPKPAKAPEASDEHVAANKPSSRARKEAAEADQAELLAAKMAGQLVELQAFQRGHFKAVRVLRDALFLACKNSAPLILGMTELREIQQVLEDAMRQAIDDMDAEIRRLAEKVTE